MIITKEMYDEFVESAENHTILWTDTLALIGVTVCDVPDVNVIDALEAENARLREALTYAWGLVEDATYNDSVMMIRQSRFLSTYYDENGIRAALAQETQP
jgi:uncharacterized protein YbaA (DUF1428 family)